MIELPTSTEEIRKLAREMIADHGKAALTVAEWNAVACEDSGKAEEAKRWMIIAGTILAMTED